MEENSILNQPLALNVEVLRPQTTQQFAKFYTVIIFRTFLGGNLEPRSRSLRNQDSLSWCKAEPDENRLCERTRNGGGEDTKRQC